MYWQQIELVILTEYANAISVSIRSIGQWAIVCVGTLGVNQGPDIPMNFRRVIGEALFQECSSLQVER